MSIQDIGSLGEFVAALATVITLIYLSAQIKQNNLITKAEFGHGLTHRLYDRFFNTAKDKEFAEFIAKDWAAEDLEDSEKSRVTWFSIMLLVDVFDVYDKVKQGLVEEKHLDMRVHMLSTGHVILGDKLYSDGDALNASERLLLHAESIKLRHPEGGKGVIFKSACPF